MAKGKSTWKYNKLLTARRNYYAEGTPNLTRTVRSSRAIAGLSEADRARYNGAAAPGGKAGSTGNDTNAGSSSGGTWGAVGAIAGQAALGIAGMINDIKSDDIVNAGENAVKKARNAQSDYAPVGDNFDTLESDWATTNPIAHVSAKDFGELGGGEVFGRAFTSGLSGVASGAGLGPVGMIAGAVGGIGTSLIGSFSRNKKAKEWAEKTNKEIDYTNDFNARSLVNRADSISRNMFGDLMANYSAFGGPLDSMDGAIGYTLATDALSARRDNASAGNSSGLYMQPTYRQLPVFANGGSIHIDPKNKGKFNATKERTGKTTEELTHSSNPLTRRRAIFAQNAAKWEHAFGGELNTQGGDFTNGMLYIDNGGSHESNPLQGVPMGFDEEGVPNLVEEGEVIFNNYVFSKRLKVPKSFREKHKLRGKKAVTFADVSKVLAKESEERPNDPISANGLEAIMAELASVQEKVRQRKGEPNEYAEGGRLYAKGSGLKSWRKKADIETNLPWLKSLYVNGDDTSAWDALFDSSGNIIATSGGNTGLYDPNGAYMQAINRIYDPANFGNWTPQFKEQFVTRLREINPTKYANLTVDNLSTTLSRDKLYSLATDGMVGGHHQIGELAASLADPNSAASNRYFYQGDVNGDPTEITDYFEGYDKNGRTWLDANPDWERVNTTGIVRDPVDVDGVPTVYTDYFFRKKANTNPQNRYYSRNSLDSDFGLVGGDNPYLQVQNAGLSQVREQANDLGGTDYYYEPEEGVDKGKPLPTWMRYAPVAGLGIAAISDAAGLTNKPDYTNADAILEAANNSYKPVGFRPVGNYLTYRPFDRDYYINKMNAEAGATRRNIMNTSGGNRATAMAGLLAADNNYLNQIGALSRQAEEYNLAQRKEVEDFNRTTNTTNSQGFLQADMANQRAWSEAKERSLRATMSAAELREKTKLAADSAKSANLSGLFSAIGDIGRENMAWNWRNFGIDTGSFGNIGDDELALLTHYARARQGKGTGTKAKGGKIKKKKGLTY